MAPTEHEDSTTLIYVKGSSQGWLLSYSPIGISTTVTVIDTESLKPDVSLSKITHRL